MKPAFNFAINVVSAAVLAVAMSAPARAERVDTTADFWRAPSIGAFADHLQRSRWQHVDRLAHEQGAQDHHDLVVEGWPADPQLERMQAWLEKGVVAAAPPALPVWSDVLAHARRIGVLASAEARQAEPSAQMLNATIGLWPGTAWLEGEQASNTPHAAALVRTIELPAIRPSWLSSEREIALGRDDAEQLSGRFGTVHRMLRVDSSTGTQGKPMLSDEFVGIALTRPLVKTVIHRDGRLDGSATHGRASRVVWGEGSGQEGCDDFVPGFALGDADADFHAAIGIDAYARSASARMNPVGSVLSIVTRDALPQERAVPAVSTRALDAGATGFATSTQLAYDIDADGVPDLVVWEGRGAAMPVDAHDGREGGKGRDANLLRHRIFFANVQGVWLVLGHDAAQVECARGGC